MHIPFVFGIDYENLNYPKYLWIFHKFVDFCKQNNFPIIAQEEYFKKPNLYNNITEPMSIDYSFSIPDEHTLLTMSKYMITSEETEQILSKYKNNEECWLDLLKNRNSDLEKIIESKIINIKKEYLNNEIASVLTWVWLPSLKAVCDKHKIKLIQLELSAIRKENYNTILGYFTFDNKYSAKKIEQEYTEFEKITTNVTIYDRVTLLTLLLKTENLDYLKKYYDPPKYQFGLDLGMPNECFFNTYSEQTHEEIKNDLKKLASKEEILARVHPQALKTIKQSDDFVIDDSKNSIEWILKCSRIVSSVSNIGFEAMLLGKTSYVLTTEMPFSYAAVKKLSIKEDEVVDLQFINYLIFGYFVPYELMFDKEYIDFRLTNPTLIEIYEKNKQFIMKGVKWNKNQPITQQWLLENFHKVDKEKIKEILKYKYDSRLVELENELKGANKTINDLELEIAENTNKSKILIQQKEKELLELNDEKQRDIKRLEQLLDENTNLVESLKEEIKNMKNSKSWKITKPLRMITKIIKKLIRKCV